MEVQPRNNSTALGQHPGSAQEMHRTMELKLIKWKMSAFFIPEKTTCSQTKETRETHQDNLR